ncbi:hypothetical protein [Methylopila sp. 73B]|uniref:hypothetical protein n=1 Tax=Methylopila sp. 73B TaxID=1120792 RepID=UPI000382EA7F|nr:hypothetical protein [Methylopila sp. 73B]
MTLKWGTLKGWRFTHEATIAAAQRYAEFGMSAGAATQNDTPDQKQALCDLIDAVDGEIVNDWSGEAMTKDEAKRYVLDYGKPRVASPLSREGREGE